MLSGCKSKDPIRLQATVEEPPPLASVIRANDPKVSSQLLSGFGAIEGNSWRWSGPHFVAVLGGPPQAGKNGASLLLTFSLPEASVKSLKQITLSGKAGDFVLSPEAYHTAGPHTYRRDLPASVFKSETLQVQFDTDKYLELPEDKRQLGVVVSAIQLDPK
jgi:hypothetical protein